MVSDNEAALIIERPMIERSRARSEWRRGLLDVRHHSRVALLHRAQRPCNTQQAGGGVTTATVSGPDAEVGSLQYDHHPGTIASSFVNDFLRVTFVS